MISWSRGNSKEVTALLCIAIKYYSKLLSYYNTYLPKHRTGTLSYRRVGYTVAHVRPRDAPSGFSFNTQVSRNHWTTKRCY